MVTIDRLHQLVEALPPEERATAARVLEALAGVAPSATFFSPDAAPFDDEPETEAERAAVAVGEADLAAGRTVSAKELDRRYGLR